MLPAEYADRCSRCQPEERLAHWALCCSQGRSSRIYRASHFSGLKTAQCQSKPGRCGLFLTSDGHKPGTYDIKHHPEVSRLGGLLACQHLSVEKAAPINTAFAVFQLI